MRLVPLAILAFVTFALGFGELMVAGILPTIATDTGVSVPLAGQLVTVYALLFAGLSPPLAIGLRTMPAKQILIASMVAVAVANMLAAIASGFSWLLIARGAAAVGSAVATPLALAAVDVVAATPFRGRAHGIVFTGFSLAAMLGVPLGALIAAHDGWRATFLCVAGLSAAAATLVVGGGPSGPRGEPLKWAALVGTAMRPQLGRTLLISGVFLTAQYTVFTYFRPYFEYADGADTATIVLLFFLYGVFGIAGTLVGGAAVDRYGTRRTMLGAIGGCGGIVALLPIAAHGTLGAGVAIAAWALTSWGFAPAVNRRLTLAAGDASDLALALNLTAFNLGIALGSAIGGATIASIGIMAIPWIAAALIGVAFMTALGSRAPAIDSADPPQRTVQPVI